ncbi:hypothetical protein QO004_000066 [Rhizobium mesoamericanum]|uniref:hypothetical protein n=1 Tax=Rhizobium mesoamericanum TaxID=1079800 RepID=UPI00278B4107|nr:hypothetical protein [Rhizobium mesoamericanum]MDQ0558293.1 hypothetical protein [Rhizobium mesoamericanum]
MELISYIGPIVALLGLVLTIWWKVEGKIEAAKGRAEKVEQDLASFRLHTAETYVTKSGMQEQTSAIMKAIESIGHRIDGLNDRLDRFYENQPRRTTRS